MRTKLFYLAILALLFAGCAREEIDTPLKSSVATAKMETEDTKSFATDEGVFTWRTGDAITIATEGENIKGTLTDGDGTPNGDFTYVANGSKLNGYALYPDNGGHKVTSGSDITFVMPDEYNLGEIVSNTNAPMLAVPYDGFNSSEPNYSFTHLGGVVRFIFNNAPAGTSKFTLSLGENKINGEFKVNFTNSAPQISTSDVVENTGNSLTTLNFTPLASAQNITLFVPVPVGDYTGFEAKLYQGETVIGEWTKADAHNNIGRRALVLMSPKTLGNAGGSIENNNASTSDQLIDAIGSATDGSTTVTMTNDIDLTEPITIAENKKVVLNLNGNDLGNGSNMITVSEGATLHIINDASAVETKAGEVITQATISSTTDIIKASKGAKIQIGENVKLETSGENASCIWIPMGAEGVTVESYGDLSVTSPGAAVISHNGNLTSGTIKILGGEICHTNDVAIYIAGNADVTIENAMVSGTTAIEQRAGSLEINGGTFKAISKFNVITNGNGTTTEGVAVAICKHNTNFDLTATINGGTFTGEKSVYFNDNSSTNEVSLLIYGGDFSSDPSEYVAPGYAAVESNKMWTVSPAEVVATINGTSYSSLLDAIKAVMEDETITIAKDITDATGIAIDTKKTFTIDFGGHTYTLNKPGAGSTGTTTSGFQILKGQNVKFKNGTIKCSDDNAKVTWEANSAEKGIAMMIQNYADLTLENMTIDGTNIAHNGNNVRYIVSNNSGNVNFIGKTSITATGKDVAFDVYKYASYTAPVVRVSTTGTITGLVEVSGGTLNVEAGNFINEGGHCVKVVNGNANFNGGEFTAQEVAVFNMAGAVDITNGTFTSNDNAVISGNGTNDNKYKGGEINISGGTFNANIQTNGYVACGIYHPQKGTLKVTGGTFNIEKGCGILMRGGSLDMTDSKATFNFTGDAAEDTKGKVGDSRVVVPCGKKIVKDAYSAYYDAENIIIKGVDNSDIEDITASN